MVGEFKKNTVTQVGVANVNLALLESGFHSFVFVSLIHYTLQIPRKSKPCSTFKTNNINAGATLQAYPGDAFSCRYLQHLSR